MRTLGLLLALACAPLAVAQEDLASRQLQNGDRLARDGKMEQALAAWRDVYERYPDSASAPMALDRLGAAAYPVERFELRGTVAGEAIARGRGYYEKIATDYRTSPLAARAAFKLGLMFSDPAARFFNLDEAYARFSTLISLYPGSQHVDGALYGLGEILARQGELDRSLIPLERVLAEHPAGEMAAEAAFLQASCLARLGARDAALRAFQIIRDQYPASRRAGLARDQITHLIRLTSARGGTALYSRSDLIRPGLPTDQRIRSVGGLDVDEEGRIAVADPRADAVHVLDAQGVPVSRTSVRQPTAVWLHQGDLLVGAGGEILQGSLKIPLAVAGRESVGEIAFLTRDSRGRMIVWDAKSGQVSRFGRDYAFETALLPGRDHKIVAVAAGTDGSVYALDSREKVVIHLPLKGEPRRIGLRGETGLERPDALAVDDLGNLFIMDASAREIVVMGPEGKPIARIASGRGSDDLFPRPAALAVNGKGEILVYDLRREGIVVLR